MNPGPFIHDQPQNDPGASLINDDKWSDKSTKAMVC